MSKIYNKNAREKALLEKAYTRIYNEEAVDVQLDHWWDFDEQDVVLKVYHGALRQLPPAAGTPEYEANSEKIFTWLKGKYPQPDDYDINKVEFQSRTADDATEWALRQNKKDEDAEMEFDERGFAKNTEAGREGDRPGGGDHDKGVKMALEALDMFKDELHVGGHPEDINVNELADAHEQLSRALHWLLDETDVEHITGGRATQRAEAEVDFKPAYGEY